MKNNSNSVTITEMFWHLYHCLPSSTERSDAAINASVSFKGTRNGLVIRLEGAPNLELLKESLQQKIASSRSFFQGAAVLFQDEIGLQEPETEELATICRKHGLNPCGNYPPPVATKIATPSGISASELEADCLLIERTLRSGQTVESNGHLVIMGDVNPGAIVEADGHILVMGTLKGMAHAGRRGDNSATIVAYRLAPSLLRIAHLVARPPEDSISLGPERALVSNGQIVVEPYLKGTAHIPATLIRGLA